MSNSNNPENSSGDQESALHRLRRLQAELPDTSERKGYRMPDTQEFSQPKGETTKFVKPSPNDG